MYYLLGEVKSLVFSGRAPVDSLCGIKDNTHVFAEGDDIWDVMLNQVSLKLQYLLLLMHLLNIALISHTKYADNCYKIQGIA